MLETPYYNLIKAIVYIVAVIVPFYFLLKSRNISNNTYLRKITVILIVFIFVQIFYQIVGALGFKLLAKGLLEPLSMVALLLFGVMYLISTLKTKQQQHHHQQQEFKK
jgi:Ca2+/Na+ antiporter